MEGPPKTQLDFINDGGVNSKVQGMFIYVIPKSFPNSVIDLSRADR